MRFEREVIRTADVLVVIVNYHAQDQILRCLASLHTHLSEEYEVMVVDNSEQPDTDRLASAAPNVRILRPGENRGFAGGCNLGLRVAIDRGFRYVLLLNPDTWCEMDFLRPLCAALESDDRLAIAAPKIFSGESSDVWHGGVQMSWWRGGPRQIRDNRLDRAGAVVEVPAVSGCAMLLRTHAVAEVGLLAEEYFLYFEDTDYCQRVRQAGWRIGYVPSAVLRHAASSTTGFQSPRYMYHFARNRIWFLRRWSPLPPLVAYLLIHLLIKLPVVVILFGFVRHQWDQVAAFSRGTRVGLLHS